MKRTIKKVYAPTPAHYVGDGFRVHNFIPSYPELSMEAMNPFIMLDYNSPFYFSPTKIPKGVDVHPHKGFETVTVAYQGKIAHHDSAGNSGTITEGEVQWMTAGSGILHKEYHEQSFSASGGIFQMVQLWINLPTKNKLTPPKYQQLTKDNIKIVPLENKMGQVEVFAGTYNGIKGPAFTFTPINLLNLSLKTNGIADFSFPKKFTTALLIIEGTIQVNESELITKDNFILLDNNANDFDIRALENTKVLIMSAQPLKEPIVAHGPFVMNTIEEINTAIQEFRTGAFGVLN